MTPTQLRAFAAVARLGSVKKAAADLGVSEAAISLHVGSLRKELDDRLFVRTAEGLAFTPGGLRLASRATEMLGLQGQTVREVRQAGRGGRLLRLATSSLFGEHAAPGLIGLFADRAKDLEVELSIHKPTSFESLLLTRSVDAVIGPRAVSQDTAITTTHFLNYQVVAVTSPTHSLADARPSASVLRAQTWLLGPSVADDSGVIPGMLRRLAIPPGHQRVYQSHAAALEEAKRGHGISLALSSVAAQDISEGRLTHVHGDRLHGRGAWSLWTLADQQAPSAAIELTHFVTTPRATQAMLKGQGTAYGRFKPAVHVTLWS